jgi:hypothetical protein
MCGLRHLEKHHSTAKVPRRKENAVAKAQAFVDNAGRTTAKNPMPAIPTPSPNPQNTAAAGTLALIGGRFEADNDALFGALRERCNGRIAILSMASGYPEEVGTETVEEFRAQGFYAEHVPIFFENRAQAAYDPS